MGDQAPEFAGTTIDDQEIKLSDLRGKVVLVDFWATWCGPCVAEMPNIRRVHEKYAEDGDFVVIGISLDKEGKVVQKFVKKKKIPWQQIVAGPAAENPFAQKYHVEGIPATFLIDGQGKVVAKDLRGRALRKEVRKALKASRLARSEKEAPGGQTAQAEEGGV